jgi:hypothetical protein
VIARPFTLTTALLVLALSACGEDKRASPDPDEARAEALAVAADWVESVLTGDTDAACGVLTPQAQSDLALAVAQAKNIDPTDDTCEAALEATVRTPISPQDAPEIIDNLRSGTHGIRAVLDSDVGTVVAGSGKGAMRIGVQEIDGAWFVTNGIDVLYGLGVDNPLSERP